MKSYMYLTIYNIYIASYIIMAWEYSYSYGRRANNDI